MGDFQQYDQDFYQTGYYVDDQGQATYSYDPNYPLSSEYQEGEGVYDSSMDTAYPGQVFQPGLPPGMDYTATGDGYEEEPPLLEELGINFEHIWQKTLTVLNPVMPADGSIMNETDLTGPVLFCIALGATLLMAYGKDGISAVGCVGMYSLLNLMSDCTASKWATAPSSQINSLHFLISCVLPRGLLGMFLAVLVIGWCSHSAAKIFSTTLGLTGQQLLVAYPCALLYGVFALLSVF
ncbi:protein YIPF5-like [Alosa alosa]|uniref:protein YIPF5-like n=1 Tax=Alosa alosa TaxID=278164 RepID=UPI0020154C20|nr:protein YIPF5-like [Alosa alosa]